MPFTINVERPIPTEDQTKVKILGMSQAFGCYPEVKRLFNKHEEYYKQYMFDERAKFQLAKSLIKALSEINIQLVIWLVAEDGKIYINNQVVFELVDEPDIIKDITT